MTVFPLAETGVGVALDLDGSDAYATDVTPYLSTTPTSAVSIGRGLQSDGSGQQTAPPSSMAFVLRNEDGRFNPRNVNGPYFGQLLRNTKVIGYVPHLITRLDIPAGVSPGLTTPDSAALSITGDIDVRIDLEMPDWQSSGVGTSIVHKWVESGNQRSWALYIDSRGQLRMYWSTTGSDANYLSSTVPIPRGPKRQTLRVTVDVDNGSGGATFRWYTGASKDASTWTAFGTGLTVAFTISFFDSTSPVGIGDTAAGVKGVGMKVFGVQVRSGIGGTVVSDVDLTALADGATTYTDAQGNVWTPAAGAELQTRDVRFTGVIPSWTPRAGLLASADSSVALTAYDDRRRLGRSNAVTMSAYRRGVNGLSTVSLIGYWPMEDAAGSTSYASGISGRRAGTLLGSPALAQDATSFPCSAPLPVFDATSAMGWFVPAQPAQTQIRFLMKLPAGGIGAQARVLVVDGVGSIARITVSVTTGGLFIIDATNATGTSLFSSGAFSIGTTNGVPLRLSLVIQQSGSDVPVSLTAIAVGQSTGLTYSVTVTGQSWATATGGGLCPSGGFNGTTFGHLTVQQVITTAFELSDQLNGYAGETATSRMRRIAAQEGITIVPAGRDSQPLGPQGVGRVIDLLTEVETADAGLLYSLRSRKGFGYRSTDSMSARDAVLSTTYLTAGVPENGMLPSEDDQALANDVTTTRALGGSEARYTVDTGPLSTQEQPNGVGVYDISLPVNLNNDADLLDRASWAAHLGTVDEPRWPEVVLDLGSGPYILGTQTAQQAVIRDLDIGDRITVTGLPDQIGAGTADVIVIGLREVIAPWSHVITAVCRPASPYRVLVWGSSRYDSLTTTVSGAHAQGATSLSIAVAGGPLWGHGSGDYDIVIGGRTMTVTGVSGTSSPQTMTIPGGLPAALSGGESVRLAAPSYWSLG